MIDEVVSKTLLSLGLRVGVSSHLHGVTVHVTSRTQLSWRSRVQNQAKMIGARVLSIFIRPYILRYTYEILVVDV